MTLNAMLFNIDMQVLWRDTQLLVIMAVVMVARLTVMVVMMVIVLGRFMMGL